jgi:O-antigen ligase
MSKLKTKISSFRALDFAILINTIGLNFMKFVPIGLIILAIAWIYEVFILKSITLDFKSKSLKKTFFILTIPFSLAVLGLINTSNFSKGFEDLGRLLPFLVFPILLLSLSNERKKTLLSTVLFGFIFGLFIRFGLDFYESAIGYTYDYNIQIFFYSYLDSDTNILSIMTLFTVLYLLDFLQVKPVLSIKKNVFIHTIILFLSVCILLLQSRIVILFFFVSLGFLFLFNWKNSRKWSIFFTGVFCSLLMLIPVFQGRFKVAANESKQINSIEKMIVNDSIQIENLPCMSSTELRYNSLKSSWNIFLNNPVIGVGTGDWRDELVKEYKASNLICNEYEQTAPHNQYLRILLKYGIIGCVIYLFYLFQLFQFSKTNRRFGQIPFLLTLIFCGLGYDLLDVGSSAPFFAFFSTWLFFEENP